MLQRIVFAVLLLITTVALSGCPFFTQDEPGVDPIAPADEAPADEAAAGEAAADGEHP